MTATARVTRIAAVLRQFGVVVRDPEVLDALLDLIGEDREAEREFLDWPTGDMDVRAGELPKAMIALAGRHGLRAEEPRCSKSRS